jgi:integrase
MEDESKEQKAKARGLFKRPGSDHWWIRFADRNGRLIRETTGTTSKKLAREILAKKKVLVAENRHLDVKKIPKITFFEMCEQWWELHGSKKRTTSLEGMMKMWKDYFKNPPVVEIARKQVEKFLSSKVDEGVSPATRNRHMAELRSMFNRCREWGLIYDNPCDGIRRLRETGNRTRFLSVQEITKLLKKCEASIRPVIVTALHTGMRRSELLKLQWSDVDLSNRVITVQESKSGKKRAIPIDDTLFKTLQVLPSRFKKGWVFPSPRNASQRCYDFKSRAERAFEAAGFTDVTLHTLRHTFASQLVMAGTDIKTVQELLGHSSLAMTQRYSHLAPDHRTRAIKILDTALKSGTKSDTVQKGQKPKAG